MLEAHSLESITKKLSSELPRRIKILKREPIHEMQFMTTLNMNQPTRYKNVSVSEMRDSKLIGILLAHPKASLPKKEIINLLPHFHLRSGEAIDFFCVGYGAYWPPEHYSDQNKVTSIEGVDWLFSEQAYSNVIDELEASSKWKYSGETELLLISAVKKTEELILDYNTAIVCNLELMSKDGAFTSVKAFFTDLFNYSKQQSEKNPTWALSDDRGIKVGKSALKDAVLSLLPKVLKENYKKAEHYAVVNIEKDF